MKKLDLDEFGGPRDVALGIGFAVLGAILFASPARVAGLDLPLPWLGLTPVFLWAVLRPGLGASLGAFGAGLLQDVISGGPIGVWAFAFLIAYAVTVGQREALLGQSGGALWIGFGLAAAAAAGAALVSGWLAMSTSAMQNGVAPELEGLGDLRSRGGPTPEAFKLALQATVTIACAALTVRPFRGFARIGAAQGALR